MRPGSRKTVQAGMITTVAVLAAASAFAQTQNSPMTGQLTFSTSADVATNRGLAAVSPGTTLQLSEKFGFSFITETSTQKLQFFGNASVSAATVPGGGTTRSFTRPTATLRYSRAGATGDVSADASYWVGDVNSSYLLDPTNPASLITDTGTLARTTASFTGNIRTNAPLGFTFTGSYNARNYNGTTNPALFDDTTTTLGVAANLRMSATTQGTVSVSRTSYVSGDQFSTQYQTLDLNFGLTHDLASGISISGNLGYQDKRTTASGATSKAVGAVGGLNITRTLPNGSVYGGLNVNLAGGTPKSVLSFGRALDLPSGTLNASLSADWKSGGPVRVLGAAAYTRQLSDGALTLDFNQSISTNNLSQDIRVSSLTLDYKKALNSVSGVNLSVSLSRSEDLGGVGPSYGRASVSAAYSRALTPDWDLSVGYSRQQSSNSLSATTAASDSLFLTLTRGIQFGF